MEQYTYLPMIYDQLMEDVDYDSWCDYIIRLMAGGEKENPQSVWTTEMFHHILELGCGSGNMTCLLLERGYEVVGVDNSYEMLELARQKTIIYGNRVILMEQDIRQMDFEIYEIDCILAVNDTFNYILKEEELEEIFSFVFLRLRKEGLFIFDISSPYKLAHVLGSNTFGESLEDYCYLWENFYEEGDNLLTMDINIFTKQDNGSYQRSTETHFQKAHSPEQIRGILQKVGFTFVKMFADFSPEERTLEECHKVERIFFRCEK